MYKCECGKEFVNAASFNGHKGHCKLHYLAKYKSETEYNKVKKSVSERLKNGPKIKHHNSECSKKTNLDVWISEKHVCEKCGRVMTEKFGSGRFCSRSCANSRIRTDDVKEKIKSSVTETIHNKDSYINHSKRQYDGIKLLCKNCGVEIPYYNKSGYCGECINSVGERHLLRVEAAKKGYLTKIKNGTHHSWQSRSIISYPENFWINVLTNNSIEFKKEFVVRKADGISNYFLDFYIEVNNIKLDLEIDGGQHYTEQHINSDKIRDEYLSSLGYLVYRIRWNEINSEEGKNLMLDKINNFLNYYKNLSLITK